MRLERLEIKGFKSFAERTVLEFPSHAKSDDSAGRKSITAVVGPNGSGKSNIADAVRWVLGEQSLKTIRGKKSEDVIFSGSSKKARLGFAEVSMYLKNHEQADGHAEMALQGQTAADAKAAVESEKIDREIDPNEFSELVITRRLYRDGESQYLINRQEARLLDINLLLAKAGFGQKSYQIVGQGMIDAVLMATPLERKEFFDDAVGIKPFQIKRDQSLRQMERTESNLWQAEMLLKELEPRLRSLTRQVKKLEQRELMQANLRGEQKKYFGHLYKQWAQELDKNRAIIQSLEPQIASSQTQLDGLKNKLNDLSKESSRSEIFNKRQADYQILLAQKNDLLKEQAILKGKQELAFEKEGKMNLAWLYRQEEEVDSKLVESEKRLADLAEIFDFKNKKLGELGAEEKNLLTQIKDWEEKIRHHSWQLSNQFSLADWSKELEQIYFDLEKLIKKWEGDDIKKKLRQLNTRLRELSNKAKTETDRKMLDQWNAHLTALLQEKERLSPLINNVRVETAVLVEKRKLLESELVGLRSEKSRLEKKIKESDMTAPEMRAEISEMEKKLTLELAEIEERIKGALEQIQNFNLEEQAKKEKLFGLEKQYQQVQAELNLNQSQFNENRIVQARLETRKENLENEIRQELADLEWLKSADSNVQILQASEFDPLFGNIQKYKAQLELIGGIDPETIQEYQETKERYDFLDNQITDLSKAMESLEKVIQELDSNIKERFNWAFNKINEEFGKFFKMLFGGGQAHLKKVEEEPVVDSAWAVDGNGQERRREQGLGQKVVEAVSANGLDHAAVDQGAEEEKVSRVKKFVKGTYLGIEIVACPPGKKLASINMLSGGERALASLALVAAIISHSPAPFVILDEADAALDEANSQRMCKIINELAQKTQFILITHNRSIMQGSDVIYGVTMGLDGVSKLLSIKLKEAVERATRA